MNWRELLTLRGMSSERVLAVVRQRTIARTRAALWAPGMAEQNREDRRLQLRKKAEKGRCYAIILIGSVSFELAGSEPAGKDAGVTRK